MDNYDNSLLRSTFPPVSEITQKQVARDIQKLRIEREANIKQNTQDKLSTERVCKKCKIIMDKSIMFPRTYSSGVTSYYCRECHQTLRPYQKKEKER